MANVKDTKRSNFVKDKYTSEVYYVFPLYTETFIKCVEEDILSSKENLNVRDTDGYTALMMACVMGLCEIVEKLISAGADVNLQSMDRKRIEGKYVIEGGWTALMLASSSSYNDSKIKILEMLIKAKVNVNTSNYEGQTALMISAMKSCYDSYKENASEFVKMLIDAGANLDLQDSDGNTALMMISERAKITSSLEVMKILIDAGANLNLTNKKGKTALMLASKSSNGYSSLEAVLMLINGDANLDLQDINGESALIIASRFSNKSSSLETVNALLVAGANPDLQDINGSTALTTASKYVIANSNGGSSLDTVRTLMDVGANVNLVSRSGCTTCLFNLVRYSKCLDIIKEVISRGASVNHLSENIKTEENYNGNSILHWCAIGIKEETSSYEILNYLETLDIDLTIKNQEGKTYKDYLPEVVVDYYVSNTCMVCEKRKAYFVILNCKCNYCKMCLDCAKKTDKCRSCDGSFSKYTIIKFS